MAELVKLEEYARLKGVHPNTVHKWLRSGRLSGTKIGKGWRLDPDAVPVAAGEKAGEVKPAADKERRESAVTETFVQRAARFNEGELSEDEMVQFAASVEKLRKAGMVAVLAGRVNTLAELQARETLLEQKELELSEKELEMSEKWEGYQTLAAELKQKEKSWEKDNAMLEAREKELEERECDLEQEKANVRKALLVKKWAGDTATLITDSAAWEEAFQQEKLPEWPITVDIHEIMSWAELPQPKKKSAKKAKKQAVDEGMFDPEE